MTQETCYICGKPATVWINVSPAANQENIKPVCADHNPKLQAIITGWSAHGQGWSVHAPTEDEARTTFLERATLYEEIDARGQGSARS